MDSSDYIQGHFDGYSDTCNKTWRDNSGKSAQYRQGYNDGRVDYQKVKAAEDKRNRIKQRNRR